MKKSKFITLFNLMSPSMDVIKFDNSTEIKNRKKY